jgi:hypothetical protein
MRGRRMSWNSRGARGHIVIRPARQPSTSSRPASEVSQKNVSQSCGEDVSNTGALGKILDARAFRVRSAEQQAQAIVKRAFEYAGTRLADDVAAVVLNVEAEKRTT